MGEQKKSQKMRKPILNKEREPCDERDCKKKTHRNRNKTQMLSRTITISIIKYGKKSRTKKCNRWKIKSNNKLKMWRKKRKKRVLTCKSPSSAIPSRIGRDCRMVAMCRVCRHIAGGRLRRFNIHSHIHGYPRAAKASPSKPSCYLRTTYCMNIYTIYIYDNGISFCVKMMRSQKSQRIEKRGQKKPRERLKKYRKKPDE